MEATPLIEHEGGAVSTGQQQARATVQTGGTTPTGPSVQLALSDGRTIVLGSDELRVLLMAVQTALLLYVAFKEASQ